jgi:tellurite resistance protein TehA-like permease
MELEYYTIDRKGLLVAQAKGYAQAGLAFAVVLALATVSDLPESLSWAAFYFGLNIPVSLMHGMMSRDWHTYPKASKRWIMVQGSSGWLANVLTVMGTKWLLQHISLLHAWAFLLILLVCALLWLAQSRFQRQTMNSTPLHLQPPLPPE